jgi:hypothetical protein
VVVLLDFCVEMMAQEICGSGIYADEDEGLRRRGIFSERSGALVARVRVPQGSGRLGKEEVSN